MRSDSEPARVAARQSGGGTLLLISAFLAATFVSAALIFAVQPMFARFVLPRLGGSPGVWSVAMAFFQAVLFAGYLYAHLLTRYAPWRARVGIQLAVSVAAILWLPLGIAVGWGDPPSDGEALWLLGLFAASIGVPYFALSANGPLMQSWFARATRPGTDPYFLYAVSNAGSFLALIAYPLLIEPMLSLQAQSRLWSVGFVVLVLLLAICGALALRQPAEAEARAAAGSSERPSFGHLVHWCLLAAVPSGLLVAVTAQISTDIAAIPLVWIVPLSLYLLSFVVVFGRWGERSHDLVVGVTPWALLLLVGIMVMWPETNVEGDSFFVELALHLGVFILVALMCHGELARRRPHADDLTVFYLAISFGGMLGGVFASLVAPNLFSWIAEYPILIVAAALCRPGGVGPRWANGRTARIVAGVAVLAVLGPGLAGYKGIGEWPMLTTSVYAAGLVIAMAGWRSVWLFALVLGVLLSAARLYPPEGDSRVTIRSFFGVHKIHDDDDGYRLLQHGTTIHGAQRIRDDEGKPITGRPEPLTYYFRGSPVHEVLEAVRQARKRPLRIGVVGLGSGSMACLVEASDDLRFFEIDAAVIEIARNPRYFSFLASCRPQVPIMIGDARLTLTREPAGAFDVLFIDAFASDAVPTHLLTREALQLYASKLAPGGLIALHLSNLHMDLLSVGHSVANAAGLFSLGKDDDRPEKDIDANLFDTTIVAAARSEADLEILSRVKDWVKPDADELAVRPWTDDYANPLGAIWRKMNERE